MFIESCTTFILIAYFDWLLGPQKGQIFEKKKSLKIFSSETVCFMKLIHICTLHRLHVPGISLYETVVFLFQSDKNSGCYGNFHRLIMGKVKNCYFCSLIGDI